MRSVDVHGSKTLPLLGDGPDRTIARIAFWERAKRGTDLQTEVYEVLHEILPLTFDGIMQRLSEKGNNMSGSLASRQMRILYLLGHIGITPMGCIKLDPVFNHIEKRGE